ncbi:MAG TPA: hypothetical protein VL977_00480 [Solirubrobacteraceae bacterium]|nr:hypothetical protein [Solirubrobacteraceae bacterium]
MDGESPTPAPARPPQTIRRLFLAALSGGLGVFGLAPAPDASAAQSQPAATPPANVAPAERPPAD